MLNKLLRWLERRTAKMEIDNIMRLLEQSKKHSRISSELLREALDRIRKAGF